MNNRLDSLNRIQPYVGIYYSINYVRRHILKQSDEDIEDIDKEINSEQELLAAMQTQLAGGIPGQGPAGGDQFNGGQQ